MNLTLTLRDHLRKTYKEQVQSTSRPFIQINSSRKINFTRKIQATLSSMRQYHRTTAN